MFFKDRIMEKIYYFPFLLRTPNTLEDPKRLGVANADTYLLK